MTKVLHSLGCLGMGGAETMLMNVYRNSNRSAFSFDFVVPGQEIGYYEPEIQALGGRIYHIPKRSESFLKNLIALYRVVKDNGYSIVHFHTLNAFFLSTSILAAKAGGAKRIIVHSHNTNDDRGRICEMLHFVFRPLLRRLTTDRLSCGTDAAAYLFGTEKNVRVIPLPVACGNLLYREETYRRERDGRGWSGKTVYAHIGRFNEVKNHRLLIEIFHEICQADPESVLILMGDGELRSEIEKQAADDGIADRVMFCGITRNVAEYLNLADCFLLPSLYEGFPTVVLEAQAAGLPCFVSDAVTKKIAETDLVSFFSLNDSPKEIAAQILAEKDKAHSPRKAYNEIIAGKYDVPGVARQFEQIYSENGR